jgi:ribonuclease HI
MSKHVAPGERLVLRTDGASRGNPGPAAAGVAIEREDGQLIARGRRFLGQLTNNQAEYRALILGLRAVASYQPAAVTVCLDSELVVQQMNGRYRVRDAGLYPLYEEALALARELPQVRFVHVPRAVNHLADALANEALDAERARPLDEDARRAP